VRPGFADLGWDGHLALLPGTRQWRRERVTHWLRRGLDSGEAVVVCEAADDLPARSVVRVLERDDADVRAAGQDGRLRVLEPAEFFALSQQIGELVEQALDEGYSGVRTCGEPRLALTQMSEREYEAFEQMLDRACDAYPLSALCQFDPPQEGDPEPAEVHFGGLRQRWLQTGFSGGVLHVAGEIDITNDEVLRSALHWASRSATTSQLRVDLSRLTHLAVTGWRAIRDSTQQFRERGGRVLVLDTPPVVTRVLNVLMSEDRAEGVELARSVS
jgi:anti-anti-sigma factor